MNNKQALIDKIIADAENYASSCIADANEKKAEILEIAEQKIAQYRNAQETLISEECANIIDRKNVVGALDCNKLQLKYKQNLLNSVFSEAKQQILQSKKYIDFVLKLLLDNAEDGDEVIICVNDSKRISKEMIEKVALSKKIKLTLNKTSGSFEGGIMLSQNGCDKNLTINTILREAREQLEPQVQAMLFEVNNAK